MIDTSKVGRGPRWVFGIDLSLTGTAVVGLSPDYSPEVWREMSWKKPTVQKNWGDAERAFSIASQTFDDIIYRLWLSNPQAKVPAVFIENYAFSMGFAQRGTQNAELGGAIKARIYEKWHIETIPVVASSARKLLFGPQKRMNRVEWKAFIERELGKMGCPIDDEDARDAFCIANAGRYQLELPCLAHG